jgi:hypothetical protein
LSYLIPLFSSRLFLYAPLYFSLFPLHFSIYFSLFPSFISLFIPLSFNLYQATRENLKKELLKMVEQGRKNMGLDILVRCSSGEPADDRNTPIISLYHMVRVFAYTIIPLIN